MKIKKRNGKLVDYDNNKIYTAIDKCFKAVGNYPEIRPEIVSEIALIETFVNNCEDGTVTVEEIQDWIEKALMVYKFYDEAKAFILYREKRAQIRNFVKKKKAFIEQYKNSSNTANATVDDNSNVSGKNIAILNSEIHKEDNIEISRGMIMDKLKELYPNFDSKQYIKDLENHIIYKHDESSFAGAISPYCCSISMYPFLLNGLKEIGGLSAAPKNIDSFCGMYVNLIFAISAQFAGACLYKDQKLFINNNGTTFNIRIKNLINKYLNTPLKFNNYQGEWEYSDVSDKNLLVAEDGKFTKITKVYRRKYNEDIYKITSSCGNVAFTSKDHKFKQLFGGRIFETKASELQIGDTIFVNKDNSIYINKESFDFKKGWIIGILCGDGSLTQENSVKLSVNYNQEYLGEIYNSYSQEVFGTTLNKNDGHRCWDYRKYSKDYKEAILQDIIENTTKDKHIDITNKSLDYLLGFLDGLFSADGSYSQNKGITIGIINKELTQNIIDICKILGVKCTSNPHQSKRENKQVIYNTYVSNTILKYLLHALKKKIIRNKNLSIEDKSSEVYYYGYNAFKNSNNFKKNTNNHNLWSSSNQSIKYKTDTIASIEIFINDDDYVYEIETESHWYNCGGFITHNCATPEFLLCFDHFAKKAWGKDYYLDHCNTKQIHQYWQQVIYSINQPSAARGSQSAFVNFSIFDKPFFDGMFGEFMFPDKTKPQWESFNWLQKEFLHWFNQERLKCILTFPVVSCTLLYKDKEFKDKEMYNFICQEYSEGNSFFLYISDTVDSLSSCCFSKDTKILWKNSYDGVKCTTLKELYDLKWEPYKKNLKIYHNGSWIKGKVIKLPPEQMYRVITSNNKEFIMTDNHINITYNGEVTTDKLTTNDYLMFNTKSLECIKESNQSLTYEQGLLIGLFIGDGSFGNYICQDGSVHDFHLSLNEHKWNKVKDSLAKLGEFILGKIYNNVYPIRCCSKELTTFISEWTTNEPLKTTAYNKNLNINCLLQSKEFRQGILDGWHITDGGNSNRCYSTSKDLIDSMEILCTSLGKQCIINISDRTDEEVIIRGESFNRNYPLYCLRWYDDTNCRQRPESGFKWKNNSIYWKIKSIEQIDYNEDVYCIQCSNEDEPYFTLPSGLITHNCRLKNKIQSKEFNFTNGNIGVMTGSKSVISLNLNRIIQDHSKVTNERHVTDKWETEAESFKSYFIDILDRVYKYQTAYNELLWDMYNANLLPVYKAGFIDLNKQYLTIGLIGLVAAADFLNINVSNNKDYKEFCNTIFSIIKKQNELHKTKKTTWNTELVPAESAAIKLYNADKADGYYVPENINLYTSYVFKPYDNNTSVLEKIILHGSNYIGDYLDGGAACNLNLDSHLSKEQYNKLLIFAAKQGCQYLTFNIPNCECEDCGFIAKQPFEKCPKCNSNNVSLWDRIIG